MIHALRQRFVALFLAGASLFLVGCDVGANQAVGAFLRDLSREALAAFLT